MMLRRPALMAATVIALGMLAGCGSGEGVTLEANTKAELPYGGICPMASSQFAPLEGGNGDWFRLVDPDVELSGDYESLRGAKVGAPVERFERITRNSSDLPIVGATKEQVAQWNEALGRGNTVLFNASSDDYWKAHVVSASFEVTADGSVRTLDACASEWDEALGTLADNHGTDVESILLEMGDPKRARELADELDTIEAEPPGPADLPWAERENRSMADPDVALETAASATKLVVRVDAPKGWQRVGGAVDLVCTRSAGVMGVCTEFDDDTTMTAWSVGGAPIEVFLAGGPVGDEVAPVTTLPGPFAPNTELVVPVDAERYPTPEAFIAAKAPIDPATVVVTD